MRQSKTLSRRELYDLVWSQPVQRLAKEFGLSDRGFAKMCARHEVPSPPRGYWAKVAAGQPVKRPLLRRASDPDLERVQIVATNPMPHAVAEAREAARQLRAKERQSQVPAPHQTWSEKIKRPHPAIAATARALRKATLDRDGAIRATGPDVYSMVVHHERRERAISFLDALARALASDGLQLMPAGNNMRIHMGPDELTFTLVERSTWETNGRIYSGQFVLVIDRRGRGPRKTWGDSGSQTLEAMFDDIVVGMKVYFPLLKREREQREDNDRQQGELRLRRELAARREKREKQRVEHLQRLIGLQKESADVRSWLSSQPSDVVADASTNLGRMVLWVRHYLSTLEAVTTVGAVDAELEDKSLFPEVDELHDPLGDPPKWGWETRS